MVLSYITAILWPQYINDTHYWFGTAALQVVVNHLNKRYAFFQTRKKKIVYYFEMRPQLRCSCCHRCHNGTDTKIPLGTPHHFNYGYLDNISLRFWSMRFQPLFTRSKRQPEVCWIPSVLSLCLQTSKSTTKFQWKNNVWCLVYLSSKCVTTALSTTYKHNKVQMDIQWQIFCIYTTT